MPHFKLFEPLRPQRECNTLLHYLSLLTAAPKGVQHVLALPFTTHCASKGSATRSCVTFYYALRLQRECNTLLRYLLLLTAPPKGVQSALALPFTAHCALKGNAKRACVTFHCSLRPQRECNTFLRYLLLRTAPPKGVQHALALPFTTHCASKGSATRACVTFHCSLRPQRECIPRFRYLSLLTAPPKGVQHALALPFTTHCASKGSA